MALRRREAPEAFAMGVWLISVFVLAPQAWAENGKAPRGRDAGARRAAHSVGAKLLSDRVVKACGLPRGWYAISRKVTALTPQGPVSKTITYYVNLRGDESVLKNVDTPKGADRLATWHMEFVRLPAGEFAIGSPEQEKGRHKNEGPVHRVRLNRPFLMQAREVTLGNWREVLGSGLGLEVAARAPVRNVSWQDCRVFIGRLCALEGVPEGTYRLPTEAEWEYACRAGTGTRWSFGDDEGLLDDYAWHAGNAWDVGEQYVHEVATRKPNPLGLCDMHGNVNEWVQDWYDTEYYPSSPSIDPPGPVSGSERVFRGGYFHNNGARRLRSANRFFSKPEARAASLGVRLVKLGP